MQKKIFFFIILLFNLTLIFAATPASWLTLKNSEYGFELKYPKTAQLQPQFQDCYFCASNSWRINVGGEKLGNGRQLQSILVFHTKSSIAYPAYFFTELRIGVSSDPIDVANCIVGSQKTININGVTFHVFPIQDNGMSQYINGFSYRTIHNNQCYALEQIETGAKPMSPPAPNDIPDSVLKKYYLQVGNIVKTFKFTN